MNQEQGEQVQEWKQLAYEAAEEVLGKPPVHRFEWCRRLTRCIGRVNWPGIYGDGRSAGYPTVKLSVKILSAAIRDHGIEHACEETYNTTLHELAHLYAGHGHGHDHVWKDNMRALGLDPETERLHSMSWGSRLASEDIRSKYKLGTWIKLTSKGEHLIQVHRHNPKNCKCYERGSGYWNLPWAWLEKNPANVVIVTL